MGQQQLLLIVIGVIIVGIAIALTFFLFAASNVASNKDAILGDLMNISQSAYRYRLRPEPLGGGGRAYTGFALPASLASNENATYTFVATASKVTFTATSKFGFGSVVTDLDSDGVLGSKTYSGDF